MTAEELKALVGRLRTAAKHYQKIKRDRDRYEKALVDMVQVVDTAVGSDLIGPIWDAVRQAVANARAALQGD